MHFYEIFLINITWYSSVFKITSKIYKQLIPLKYTDYDFENPIEIKSGKTWTAVGQFKSDTTILHGIGIIVYNFGAIKEGHFVDDTLEGLGIHTQVNI